MLVAGWLVAATNNSVWDTVVALAIGIFVAVRALVLGRQVLAVLAQHVPESVDLAEVTTDLEAIPGVRDVHDLHLWTLTSGMLVATAHLVSDEGARTPDLLDGAKGVLRDKHGVLHATLQVEPERSRDCHELDW